MLCVVCVRIPFSASLASPRAPRAPPSRRGNSLLSEASVALLHPPKVLVVASGIGYYGTHTSGVVTEGSPKGTGFLADVRLHACVCV